MRTRFRPRYWLSVFLCISGLASAGEAGTERLPIPPLKLWKDVQSPELKAFKPPVAERFVLSNGLVVFLLEDHELPLIDLSMVLRFGQIHEPAERTGVAEATASVLRSGGSDKYPGDKLDEILDSMPASLSVGIGLDSGSAGLSTLKADFDKGLEILVDVLRNPAFPEDKLELYLDQARTAISRRNDSPGAIAGREFERALYGEKSPYAKVLEYAHLNKLNRQALQDFHRAFFHPGMFIVGVAGDFGRDEMLARLKAAFGDWPAVKVSLPEAPDISTSKKKKTLFVDRPKLNQTTVTFGHIVDLRRDHKDYPAMQALNQILSGGMSARMFTEVRTKKGLAYSVWGYAQVNYDRPGVFSCTALTRNEQALEALDAMRQEVVRIREQAVTEAELAEARERIINSFVFNFDRPAKIIGRQMTYELYKYPMDFAEKLLEAIKRVTPEHVQKVADKYLDPGKCVLLGVGNSGTDSAGQALEERRSFRALKDVQFLDVTIPQPQLEPMAIDPQREAEGRKILAQCMEAAGGLEEFRNLNSVQANVSVTYSGYKLRGLMRAQLPDKARVDVNSPLGAVSQVISGDAAWKASGGSVEEREPQEARKDLRTLLQSDLGILRELAVAREAYNVQALDPSRDGDRELLGVEIESRPLGRIKIWFDAKTKLMAKLRYVTEGAQKEYDKIFSGHTRFGNITLARIVMDKDPNGPQAIELQSLELNPKLDAALFTRPEKATPPPKEKE
ncbi:MAG: pitrilysin family protein [Planctomycetota bacterium]